MQIHRVLNGTGQFNDRSYGKLQNGFKLIHTNNYGFIQS